MPTKQAPAKPVGTCVVIGCYAQAEPHPSKEGRFKAMCAEHAAKIHERAQALDVDGMVALLCEYTGADPGTVRQAIEDAFVARLRATGVQADEVQQARVMFLPGGTV